MVESVMKLSLKWISPIRFCGLVSCSYCYICEASLHLNLCLQYGYVDIAYNFGVCVRFYDATMIIHCS